MIFYLFSKQSDTVGTVSAVYAGVDQLANSLLPLYSQATSVRSVDFNVAHDWLKRGLAMVLYFKPHDGSVYIGPPYDMLTWDTGGVKGSFFRTAKSDEEVTIMSKATTGDLLSAFGDQTSTINDVLMVPVGIVPVRFGQLMYGGDGALSLIDMTPIHKDKAKSQVYRQLMAKDDSSDWIQHVAACRAGMYALADSLADEGGLAGHFIMEFYAGISTYNGGPQFAYFGHPGNVGMPLNISAIELPGQSLLIPTYSRLVGRTDDGLFTSWPTHSTLPGAGGSPLGAQGSTAVNSKIRERIESTIFSEFDSDGIATTVDHTWATPVTAQDDQLAYYYPESTIDEADHVERNSSGQLVRVDKPALEKRAYSWPAATDSRTDVRRRIHYADAVGRMYEYVENLA